MNTIVGHRFPHRTQSRSRTFRLATMLTAVALTVLAVSLPDGPGAGLTQSLALAATGAACAVFACLLVMAEGDPVARVTAHEAAGLFTAATVGPFLCHQSLYAAATGSAALAAAVAIVYSTALLITAWAIRWIEAQDAQDGCNATSS